MKFPKKREILELEFFEDHNAHFVNDAVVIYPFAEVRIYRG